LHLYSLNMEVSENASCQCLCLLLNMAPKKLQKRTLAGQVERARFDDYRYCNKKDVVMVGVESVRLLVVHHNAFRVPRLRILRAAERIVKCLQEGDDLNDICNC
jgi:hypothetical protein